MRFILGFILLLISGSLVSQTFEVEKVEFTFEVKELEKINSKFSDFNAVLHAGKIIFTSDRDIDYVTAGENNWKKGKHYNIISFDVTGDSISTAELKKPKIYSEKFTSNSHCGPICFSETGDTIFFSRVEKAKLKGEKGKFHFKPQLYMCFRAKNGYGSLQKLELNQDGYSFSHPSYDSKNKVLYFASDVKGGKGAGDIYRSKMDSTGNFSEIENLGGKINTASNEMFPFFYQGELFFSSDRKGGFGDLDVYWTYENKKNWKKPMNMGETLNTDEDDFGINIYADYTRGFISSNVEGSDDIYYFNMEKKVTIQNELVGTFSYRNLDNDASGIKIQMTSDDLDMVFETVSDENGKFHLRELPSGQKYKINIVNNNEDDLYVTFYNEDGEITSTMIINGKGKFDYKQLDSDKSLLAVIDNEDDFDINMDYTGKIVTSDNQIPEEKLEIRLIDSDGNVIKVMETDDLGNFQFKEIDYRSSNRFQLANADDDYALFVFNSKGEVVSKLKIDENGIFNFRKLSSETTNLEAVNTIDDFDFNGVWYYGQLMDQKNKVVLGDAIGISVYDKNENQIGNAIINDEGKFFFGSLPVEEIYLFKSSNVDDTGFSFWVFDHKGKVIAKLYRDKNNQYFVLKNLESDSSNIATTDYNENTNFNFNNNTNNTTNNNTNNTTNNTNENDYSVENERNVIYFDKNSSYMTEAEKKKLQDLLSAIKNHKGKVVIEGHTDIDGEDEYNIWLSERRTQRVYQFLLSNGVSNGNLSISHHGERQPEKKCEGADCGEDIDKLNRRVVILMR